MAENVKRGRLVRLRGRHEIGTRRPCSMGCTAFVGAVSFLSGLGLHRQGLRRRRRDAVISQFRYSFSRRTTRRLDTHSLNTIGTLLRLG